MERTEMTAIKGVNRIDHYVIQVNDLWRSYEFYRKLLGAKADQIAGMDTGRLWHRGNQILFIEIAGHKGVGLCISNVEVPYVKRKFEHYTVGFQVTNRHFEVMETLLRDLQIPQEQRQYESGSILKRALFFQDPDGHTIELCVRNGVAWQSPLMPEPQDRVIPLRISHIRVEVSDPMRSSRWFQEVLGFEELAEHGGEIHLKVQSGDQLLILRPCSELSPRREFVRGPHIDFEVPPDDYTRIFERIQDREGYWEDAPHPFKGPRTVDHSLTVYFRDPDGNRYQVSPAGSHV